MSHALGNGLRRVYRDHRRPDARLYRDHVLALRQRFGPLDPLTEAFASGVARLWVAYQQDSETVDGAVRAREEGKGRRPSTAAVARLRKRQGLAWGSYASALDKLAELTAGRPRVDPLAALRGAVERAAEREVTR